MSLEFVKFDPFNIACYEEYTKKIYVDKAFENESYLNIILNHELKHMKSEKLIDIEIDYSETSLRPYYWKILKKKPLWLFSFLFPFIGYKKEKWDWGFDYSRIISLAFFLILMISFLIIF